MDWPKTEEAECRECLRKIFYSTMVHSWVHSNFLPVEEQHQANPFPFCGKCECRIDGDGCGCNPHDA